MSDESNLDDAKRDILRWLDRDPRRPYGGKDFAHPDPNHWTNTRQLGSYSAPVRSIDTAPSWRRDPHEEYHRHHKVKQGESPWVPFVLLGVTAAALVLLWVGRAR
jgi:hypothetical protein